MKYEKTKVSIIIPIYNVGVYFKECIESVLSQKYKEIEIILVDDGSTDNSGLIADEYALKDNRIKVIHQENSGVSTARNVGIDHATGDFVCFADPDDVLKPDYVEYMVELCMNNECDVAVCAEVFTTFMPNQRKENIEIIDGEEAAAQILYGKITVGCYSKIYRKQFLNDNKLRFFPDVYIGEGFNFNVHTFCAASKVAVSQHKVYYYRLDNTTSAMNKFSAKKCEMGLRAIEIMREKLTIRSKKLLVAVDFAEWNTYASMYEWMVQANAKQYYPELYTKCKKKTKSLAYIGLFAPTTPRIHFVAIIRMVHPFIWAYARVIAKKIAYWREKKSNMRGG